MITAKHKVTGERCFFDEKQWAKYPDFKMMAFKRSGYVNKADFEVEE